MALVSISLSEPLPAAAPSRGDRILTAGLAGFALYHFALAVFMALAPHAFYTSVGPFGSYNSHYIRDTATYNAALGVGFAVSIARPAWRVPVLAVATVQFALHSLNHLIDVDTAHPAWTGYFDFFSLFASTLLLGALLASARSRSATSSPAQGETP